MAVVWDPEHGSHHLDDGPVWPPMGFSNELRMPDDLRQEAGPDAHLLLQPRQDGTTWVYEPGGRLLGVKAHDSTDTLQSETCPSGHRYLRAASWSATCPVCQPPRVLVPASAVEADRKRTKRGAILAFLVAVPLLAAGAWLGDRYYERSALDILLTEVEAIERPDVWGQYLTASACGRPIEEEPASRVITARAPTIARSAIELADRLEVGVARIQDVRIAPWHRELELARDRIRDHERVWIDFLRTEADMLNELDGVTHRGDQKKILDPYADWLVYTVMSIEGTFLSAHDAFNNAVASAADAHRHRVDVIFDLDVADGWVTCSGEDS